MHILFKPLFLDSYPGMMLVGRPNLRSFPVSYGFGSQCKMRYNGSQIISVYYMKMFMAYSYLNSEMSIFITILINVKI
jgi:hypothetical protein